jgi:hypothetical protein
MHIIQLRLLIATTFVLSVSGGLISAQETAHGGDMTINPAQISETARLGPRSFSPYANRSIPTRPQWADQNVHSG